MFADRDIGSLTLIIGPMFSGKTSELIRLANRYKNIDKKILAINHQINTRYNTNEICSHDKIIFPNSLSLEKLSLLLTDDGYIKRVMEADVIIVEESQFFNKTRDTILHLVEKQNKHVICAGLDGDYLREPFGDILTLIPIADKVMKLYALCKLCNNGTKALFSKKIEKTVIHQQIIVGESDKFIPVCRKCFLIT